MWMQIQVAIYKVSLCRMAWQGEPQISGSRGRKKVLVDAL